MSFYTLLVNLSLDFHKNVYLQYNKDQNSKEMTEVS